MLLLDKFYLASMNTATSYVALESFPLYSIWLDVCTALVTCPVPTKNATPPNFAEKTFANSHKTLKFAKVSRYMV